MEVLKSTISPTMPTPAKTIAAPIPVTRAAIESQTMDPAIPALPKPITEMKNSKPPTITFGCPKTNLTLESKNANAKKINGRRIDDQEKYFSKKLLNVRSATP